MANDASYQRHEAILEEHRADIEELRHDMKELQHSINVLNTDLERFKATTDLRLEQLMNKIDAIEKARDKTFRKTTTWVAIIVSIISVLAQLLGALIK